MSSKLAAVVVLYNPENEVLRNIDSYIDYVEKLFAVDNSEKPNLSIKDLLENNPKIEYISGLNNAGIAKALNIGATRAIDQGYEWLLTMDEDSMFESDIIQMYSKSFDSIQNLDDVAVIACNHYNPAKTSIEINKDKIYDYNDSMIVITSGNWLNLNIYKQLGGFNDKLFIDCVDHEYCLRAKVNNHRILEFSNLYLNHNLGKLKDVLGGRYKVKLHSPERLYYMTRNSLYFWCKYFMKYPLFMFNRFIRLQVTMLRNIIFGDRKLYRISCILKGVTHFLLGRYGRMTT